MKNLEQLKQIKASLKEAQIKYLESKGHKVTIKGDDLVEEPDWKGEVDYMYMMMRSLGQYVASIEQALFEYVYQHAEGHLPPVQGAEKMQAALKALGMDKDYEVKKPVLYANASHTDNGLVINVELNSK